MRVPASSANLGPGFDTFCAALALHVELEVVETGRFGVETNLDIARDRRNLCVRGFAKLLRPTRSRFASARRSRCRAGSGSSAAAYVAGLSAAAHLLEHDGDLLADATELEGHPDNAAAALLGGFVIVGGGEAARFDPPPGLEAVLVVPHAAVRTSVARRALPATVPLADAVANVAHGALLTLGLARGDLSLVARGLARPPAPALPRAPVPESMALLERATELGAIGATVSGAGPTVLFWTQADATGAVVGRAARRGRGLGGGHPRAVRDPGRGGARRSPVESADAAG